MDRQITYPGQLMPETTVLQMTKDAMIGAAKLASALLGTSTMASGFAVTPTGPASLQVVCAPGEIYSLATIDALAFSTLPADTTHSILKQGIMLDGVTLSCPAPVTTGQSINYLVQVTYQDSDASPVLLPYYNSANPAMPYSGMGNNGLPQNTVRKGVAIVAAKAGASAATGSQVTPAPDAGYIGLYVVTVAFGQTTITSGNIALAAAAPLINSTLHGLAPVFTVSPSIPAGSIAAHAVQFGQIAGVVGQARNVRMAIAAASASATMTADEIIVETALGGLRYCLPSFNKTVNLATTGAGGMDTGTAPVSGYVSVYAIYNPTTGTSALLACAQATSNGSIYSGANMPAGYTASALVSSNATNASSQFKVSTTLDRTVIIPSAVGYSSSGGTIPTPTLISIAAIVPLNAKFFSGILSPASTISTVLGMSVAADAASSGYQNVNCSSVTQITAPFRCPITTPQGTYITATASGGTPTYSIAVSSYEF